MGEQPCPLCIVQRYALLFVAIWSLAGVLLLLAAPSGTSCLSIEYRYFVSARAQVLSRASAVLGSPTRASSWFVSRILSLDGQQPCRLLLNANKFPLVMDVLTRLEHGIF